MTIGELLRQVSHEYDSIEVEPLKWITMEFSCRVESDGSVHWESPSAKYDEAKEGDSK